MSPTFRILLAGLLIVAGARPALPQSGLRQDRELRLRYATFDPLEGEPSVPPALTSPESARLWIVQFETQGFEIHRQALRALGAEVHTYLPHHAHLVRTSPSVASAIERLSFVRWVGRYHPAYRLEDALIETAQATANGPSSRALYNVITVTKSDKPQLIESLHALGAEVVNPVTGSLLLEAALTPRELRAAANLDEVLWIDRWSAPEEDLDRARIEGGAADLETLAGYDGSGLRGHVLEGVEMGHPDFLTRPPIAIDDSTPSSHGHCTYGIVFGSGANNANARGILPGAQGYFTHNSAVTGASAGSTGSGSRYELVGRLKSQHEVLFQTASWGYSRTSSYTSRSAEMDQIIFDHDMTITQSQSNSGGPPSRPQAWAKNILSVGGINHQETLSRIDDRWDGGGSTGPSEDGRIKPDLCAYYDTILTADRPGSSGYSSGDYYASFGGTSGATPIVAGYVGLVHQLWSEGVFGNTLRNPGGSAFENRAHFTTIKALLINTARAYDFSGTSDDLTRTHQGWGWPNVKDLYDLRTRMLVIDEEDVLTNLETARHEIVVLADEPRLHVTLVYADPPGAVSAALQRVNDLSLRVTDPNGIRYWGNHGLLESNVSLPGGVENEVDTVENVFVTNPVAGTWQIEVIASEVNVDAHVETPEVDVDYALVVSGGTAPPPPTCTGTILEHGSGCQDFLDAPCTLDLTGLPCTSADLTFRVGYHPWNPGRAVLMMGLSDTHWRGVALPLDVSSLGTPGCHLYVGLGYFFPLPLGLGSSTLQLPIPDDPFLWGIKTFWQGMVVIPSPLRLSTSEYAVLTIGQP